MILSGDVDYKGSDVCGVSCIAPGDIGRRETIHVPTGPSSLDKINLVENAGECNADFVNKMAPPSGKISTENSTSRSTSAFSSLYFVLTYFQFVCFCFFSSSLF